LILLLLPSIISVSSVLVVLTDDILETAIDSFLSLASLAASFNSCSFFKVSTILIDSCSLFLSLISFFICFSVRYSTSVKVENLSLTSWILKFLLSADKRISRGIVKPLAFFQLDIQGGTF